MTVSKNLLQKTRFKKAGFLFSLKVLVSYLWPIRIEATGKGLDYLELSLYKGRLHLNTLDANYSYGNLQVAFENCFNEEMLDWNSISNTLILGFGLGGVVDLLQKRNPKMKFTAVEINPIIIEWHLHYFHKTNLKLIQADALEFMTNNKNRYDLIIVDLYQNLNVPMQFETIDFIKTLKNSTRQNGNVIFNKVVQNDVELGNYNSLMLNFSLCFKSIRTNHQFDLNRFIISK